MNILISNLSQDDATEARNAMNGADLDHRKIRVDYSITKRPHTPTPGMYMGRPTSGSRYAVDTIIYDEQFVIA